MLDFTLFLLHQYDNTIEIVRKALFYYFLK